MSEKEYLDVVGFIKVGREQKSKVLTLGYAFRQDDGGLRVQLQTLPAGNTWDGSMIVQKRREQATNAPAQGTQQSSPQGRSYGKGGRDGGGSGSGNGRDGSRDDMPF